MKRKNRNKKLILSILTVSLLVTSTIATTLSIAEEGGNTGGVGKEDLGPIVKNPVSGQGSQTASPPPANSNTDSNKPPEPDNGAITPGGGDQAGTVEKGEGSGNESNTGGNVSPGGSSNTGTNNGDGGGSNTSGEYENNGRGNGLPSGNDNGSDTGKNNGSPNTVSNNGISGYPNNQSVPNRNTSYDSGGDYLLGQMISNDFGTSISPSRTLAEDMYVTSQSYSNILEDAKEEKRKDFKMTLGHVTEITGSEFVNLKGPEVLQKNLFKGMDTNLQKEDRTRLDPSLLVDKESKVDNFNPLYFISKRDVQLPWYTFIFMLLPIVFLLSFIPACKKYYEGCLKEYIREY